MKLLVINGPNINMLGIRQPEIYGTDTYDGLVQMIECFCEQTDIEVECFQSNHEGDIVDKIQYAYHSGIDGIVINPGAYTHTSIAIADALLAVNIPYVEVHVSDVMNREPFRRNSFTAAAAKEVINGNGIGGYIRAIKLFIS